MGRNDAYEIPEKTLHRSFAYLNDDLVINSLSAFEAGQIDSVVSKISEAREGGLNLSGSIQGGIGRAEGSGGKKKQSTVEDELIRSRTRFSIFEAWLSILEKEKALGEVRDPTLWQTSPIEVGHTVRIRGTIKMREVFSLVRMFLSYAHLSKDPNHPFYVKGEGAKGISKAANLYQNIFGKEGEMKIPAYLENPQGKAEISFILDERFLTNLDHQLDGTYTVIGQVSEVVAKDDWYPTIRFMPLVPKNEFERQQVRKAFEGLEAPANTFGIHNIVEMAEFNGPALILEPIAIFR